jgi:Ulp1 family protease
LLFNDIPLLFNDIPLLFNDIPQTEGKNVFGLDKLLIPINIYKTHWFLAVIYMQERTVQILDSCPGFHTSHQYYLDLIKKYLSEEYSAKNIGHHLPQDWSFHGCPPNSIVPQQDAGTNDCGVFVCYFMDLVMDNCPITDLTQEAIVANGRNWLCATILNKKIRH